MNAVRLTRPCFVLFCLVPARQLKFFQVYEAYAFDFALAVDILRARLHQSSRFRKFVNVRDAGLGKRSACDGAGSPWSALRVEHSHSTPSLASSSAHSRIRSSRSFARACTFGGRLAGGALQRRARWPAAVRLADPARAPYCWLRDVFERCVASRELPLLGKARPDDGSSIVSAHPELRAQTGLAVYDAPLTAMGNVRPRTPTHRSRMGRRQR